MTKKRHGIKRIVSAIALVLLAMFVLAPAVKAADGDDTPRVDLTKKGLLRVETRAEWSNVEGMEFRVYKIADMPEIPSYIHFQWTERFEGYSQIFDPDQEGGYAKMAQTLKQYVERDALAPDYSATANAYGVADFGEVDLGVYLILSDQYEYRGQIYNTLPSIVTVPVFADEDNAEDAVWEYDVIASPKPSRRPVGDNSQKISVNVVKIWKDVSGEPIVHDGVKVALSCNGDIIGEVTLSDENNWRYSWGDLDPNKEYILTEDESTLPKGYTVSIEPTSDSETLTFTVTNTEPDEPVEREYKEPTPTPNPPTPLTPTSGSKLPQTGQNWIPPLAMLGLGALLTILGIARRQLG